MSNLTRKTFGALNYKAIVVATVGAYIIGALWYSPVLFEDAWMNAHGYDRAQVDAILEGLVPVGFISSFLAYAVTCVVTALLCQATGVESAKGGAAIGFALWLGYAASLGLMLNLFSANGLAVWLIDSTFQLVFLVGIGAVLGVWRKASA